MTRISDRLEVLKAKYWYQFNLRVLWWRLLRVTFPRVRQLEDDLENERMRVVACSIAALGWFEGAKPEYHSVALSDVLKLRQKADDLQALCPVDTSLTEAVLDFAAWISTRDETIYVGATQNASRLAELVDEWQKLRGLPPPREDFHKRGLYALTRH